MAAAVRIANRFLDKLTPAEQEHALIALVETGTSIEAGSANDVLYYQRKRNEAQLTLKAILDGVGRKDGEQGSP